MLVVKVTSLYLGLLLKILALTVNLSVDPMLLSGSSHM